MLVNANGSATPAEVRTVATFNTTAGLTVAIDVLINTASGGTNGGINLINNASPNPIDTYASIITNQVTYAINGSAGTVPWTADLNFHRFTFTVSPTGTASWSRDGVVQFTGTLPIRTIYVDLRDTFSGTNYDNALITSP